MVYKVGLSYIGLGYANSVVLPILGSLALGKHMHLVQALPSVYIVPN